METPRVLKGLALMLFVAAGIAQGVNDDGSAVPLWLLLGGILASILSHRLARRNRPPN